MPLETLRKALSIWPTTQDADLVQLREAFSGIVSADFEQVDFLNIPDGGRWGIVSKPLASDSRAVFLVYPTGSDTPNLAVLVLEPGGWRLQSLKFQCPGCFGTGELTGRSIEENQPCYLCGATGWGAS